MTLMKDTVIYTAIFNDYDTLKNPLCLTQGCDYVCFTNNNRIKSKKWQIVKTDIREKGASLTNRMIKILAPYHELKQYRYSLYIDGTVMIKSDLSSFLYRYRSQGLVNFRHPRRDCVYREFAACIASKKGDPLQFIRQCHNYAQNNMPFGYGLSDNKIILRDNQNPDVRQLMMLWWEQVLEYGGRDQTCLPYVLYKNSWTYRFFEETLLDNPYFEIWPHRHEYKRRLWRNFRFYCLQHNLFDKQIIYLENKMKARISAKKKADTF